MRSLWPVHVPTRDTASALNAGVATRIAKIAEYKRGFMAAVPMFVLEW
jgi:hypothetical protein